MLARAVGAKITEAWGQQVIVENRPGAGTNIGTEVAAKSPPDGYTLFMPTVANAINPTLLREAQLRSAPGLRAHHQLRESARHRGVPSVGAGEEREGAGRAREGQAGLAAARLDGHRQPAPPRGGDLQEHDRREDDPRARTRAPRPRADRRRGGPHRDLFRRDGVHDSAREERAPARAGRHQPEARRGRGRHAHARRAGTEGLRDRLVVRHVGARPARRATSSRGCTPSRSRPSRRRTSATA